MTAPAAATVPPASRSCRRPTRGSVRSPFTQVTVSRRSCALDKSKGRVHLESRRLRAFRAVAEPTQRGAAAPGGRVAPARRAPRRLGARGSPARQRTGARRARTGAPPMARKLVAENRSWWDRYRLERRRRGVERIAGVAGGARRGRARAACAGGRRGARDRPGRRALVGAARQAGEEPRARRRQCRTLEHSRAGSVTCPESAISRVGLRPARRSDSSIDAIWSFDVFVHVAPLDVAGYLDEFARVLRPSGVAVLHHADGRNRGRIPSRHGYRAPMSRGLFAALAAERGLAVEAQLDSWGPGGRFDLAAYGDVISVLRNVDTPPPFRYGRMP